MQFQMKVDMNNAAFAELPAWELERLLRVVLNGVRQRGVGVGCGESLRDLNGNTVGEWRIEVTP